MIFTEKFNFIHLPKTGGTFIQKTFRDIYYKRRRTFFGVIAYFLHTEYIVTHWIDELIPTANTVWGQHGGVNQIPKKYLGKPILSVIRNPFDRYSSQYHFNHWERNPILSSEVNFSEHPNFPNLTMLEVLNLYNSFVENYGKKIGVDLKGMGYYTWQFIQYYFKNPDDFIKEFAKNKFDMPLDTIKSHMYDVHFIKQENLNLELHNYLKKMGYHNISHVINLEKILPRGEGRGKQSGAWKNELDDGVIDLIKNKDKLIFELFPEYKI